MKLNLSKQLILAFVFGCLSFVSQNSVAASPSDNVALNQDWHSALPAELPAPQQEMASLDQ